MPTFYQGVGGGSETRPLHPLGFADKAVWVDVFQGAGFREFFDLLAGQLPTARADVVFQLFQRAGADDRGGHAILPEDLHTVSQRTSVNKARTGAVLCHPWLAYIRPEEVPWRSNGSARR